MLKRFQRRLPWALAGLVVLALVSVYMIGSQLTAPASRIVGPAPASLPAESVLLATASSGSVAGWFAPGRPDQGAVLLLHGVRSDRSSMLGRAQFLHKQGFAVLLIDLPAHGESTGERITFGARESQGVQAALSFLARRQPGERIGVVAVSLGAASLALGQPQPAPAAVVLEAMYPTIDEAVADRLALHLGEWARPAAPLLLLQLPWWLGVSSEQLRPIDKIAQLGSPLLLIAGEQDQHTRLEESQRLFAAAAAPKSLWVLPGAAHVDFHAFDTRGYEARVGAFLASHLRAVENARP